MVYMNMIAFIICIALLDYVLIAMMMRLEIELSLLIIIVIIISYNVYIVLNKICSNGDSSFFLIVTLTVENR